MKRLIVAGLLLLELSALTYAAVISWLWSVWFLDDHLASQMKAGDWWLVAAERVALCAAGAGCFAAVTYLATRFMMGRAGIGSDRLPFVNAAIVFAIIVAASLAGALQFAITRPYM